MKKTWFVMLLVLLSSMAVQAAGSNNENYLTADPIEVVSINGALRLERLELPITMVNSVSIAGFQCDIMFPNGIAPINNEGQYEVALSSRVNDDYKVEVRKLSNGALRLLVYTFTASSIVGNDGVILTMGVMPNENYKQGEQIVIRNIVMTSTDFVEYSGMQTTIDCYIKESLLGDTNRDKKVNVTDVVHMGKYLVGDYEGAFDTDAADENKDRVVDGNDLTSVGNMVVTGSLPETANDANEVSGNDNRLVAPSIEVVKLNGTICEDEVLLPISMVNSDEISGFQCDIVFPNGIAPVASDGNMQVALSHRTSDHLIKTAWQANGALRVLVYSPNANAITDNSGEIFTITLCPNSQYNPDEDIVIRNITMATTSVNEYNCESVSIDCVMKESMLGDTNRDTKVNVTDVVHIGKYLSGYYEGAFDKDAADENRDKQVDDNDLTGVGGMVVAGALPETANNTTADGNVNRLEAAAVEVVELNGTICEDIIALPISIVNSDEISGFQCDIVFPQGIVPVEVDGKLQISLIGRTSDHIIKTAWLDNGALRVLVYSPLANAIAGNEGKVFSINLRPNAQYSTDERIVVRNITMATTDVVEYNSEQLSIDCVLRLSTLGDINRDNIINITDLVILVNMILEIYDGEADMSATDVMQDGTLDISDVVALVNLIMSFNEDVVMAPARTVGTKGSLSLNNIDICNNDYSTIEVALNNSTPYTAFQMDVTLPQGLSVSRVELSQRAIKSHNLMWNMTEDGTLRILAFALDNAPISNYDGTLFNIDVYADSEFVGGEVVLNSPIFATRDLTTHTLDEVVAAAHNITGVNGINVVNDIYSIDRTIVVVSDVAQTCTVTTAAGMTESYALTQGYNEIMVANAGMYIVSTGNMIKKLIVK